MPITRIATTTVGSGGATSIDFTGIPGTAKDLLCLVSARSDLGGVAGSLQFRFNSDTSSNYAWMRLVGDGSAASASSFSSQTAFISSFGVNGSPATSNTFSTVAVYVPNYTASQAKSISAEGVAENNGTEAYQVLSTGRWSGTSAITSLSVFLGGNFTQYTTASLYIIS